MSTPRRRPQQIEKHHQAAIVELARTLHGQVWVLGTRRGRGSACPRCGAFTPEYQGLRQTPGHPDLVIFLPPPAFSPRLDPSGRSRRLLYWEVKRPGGRLRDEQDVFRALAAEAGVDYGVGSFDDFVTWTIAHGYCREVQFPFYRRPSHEAHS